MTTASKIWKLNHALQNVGGWSEARYTVSHREFGWSEAEQFTSYASVTEPVTKFNNCGAPSVGSLTDSNQEEHVGEGITLQNLSYSVKIASGPWWKGGYLWRKDKLVLDDISITCHAGELTAFLGNSGSGKTSLLEIISDQLNGTKCGTVLYCGQELKRDMFFGVGGYVNQLDDLIYMPNLTVHQYLSYVAQLQLCGKSNYKELVKTAVEDVLLEMKLTHVKDVKVGGHIIKGISGGEKRRLAIGLQLLRKPHILLLDEPTTGLDSFTAHEIMENLYELAHTQNKLVITTIHQPRSDLFPFIDQVGLLSSGRMVFYGPRVDVIYHFKQLGFPCPHNANPLDYLVDITSIDSRVATAEAQSRERVNGLIQAYKTSDVYRNMTSAMSKKDDVPKFVVSPTETGILFFVKTSILARRSFHNISKDYSGFFLRLSNLPIFGALVWLFCLKIGKDYSSVQDRTGLLYQCIAVPPMVGVLIAVAQFPSLLAQYKNESRQKLCSSASFVTAYILFMLPFHLVASTVFSVWIYWGCGLYPDVWRFMQFLVIILLGSLAGEVLMVFFTALMIPSVAESVETLFVSVTFLLASGLLRYTEAMLEPLQYLTYICHLKYVSEILVANEYHDLQFTCDNGQTCLTGDAYLEIFYPGAVENIGRNFGILVGFEVFYVFITVVVYATLT